MLYDVSWRDRLLLASFDFGRLYLPLLAAVVLTYRSRDKWRPRLARLEQNLTHRRLLLLVACVWLACFTLQTLTIRTPAFPLDDGYIVAHNAQVLLSGHDANFPGASALIGSTSPIHLLLVTLLSAPCGPLWGLYLSLWISALAYALGLVRLAFAWKATPLQACLLVMAGLLAGMTIYQLFNGVETGLAMAAVVWGLALALEPDERDRPLLPALCGLFPFVRPELTALAGLLLFYRAWERRKAGEQAWIRKSLADLAVATATALPWLAWIWISTGSPWPATIAAKRAWFAEGRLPAAGKTMTVYHLTVAFAATLGALSLGGLFLLLRRFGWMVAAFAGVLLFAYWLSLPGALFHNWYRYQYLLVPCCVCGIAGLLADKRPYVRWATLGVAVLAAYQSAVSFPARWQDYVSGREGVALELQRTAEWCNLHLPPRSVLLSHDIGYLSYGTHFRIVDLVGLKSPQSIPEHLTYSFPTCGRLRYEADHRIALKSGARYLVVLDDWDTLFGITYGLKKKGWHLTALRCSRPGGDRSSLENLLHHPLYYEVYQLTPPSGDLTMHLAP